MKTAVVFSMLSTVFSLSTPGRAVEVVAWGGNACGQTDVPSGLSNVVAIAAGDTHSLALTADGRVVPWGANPTPPWSDFGQAGVPSGLSNVVAIAAGGYHSLALTTEGRAVGWGAGTTNSGVWPEYGQAAVPDGLSNVVAIAAGDVHSLALTADGQVIAWGDNYVRSFFEFWSGQAIVPRGLSNVVAIAAGAWHSLALTAQGRVVAWGDGWDRDGWGRAQGNVPDLSNIVAISAAAGHNLALTAEGRVVAWGDNGSGQTNVPSGLSNVVAIVAEDWRSLALTADGRVVLWSTQEPTNAPVGLSNVVAIAAGDYHDLALTGLPPGVAPPEFLDPRLLVATADWPFHYRVIAKNGVTRYGAAGLPQGLVLDPISGLITGVPEHPGTYSVVLSATNTLGSTTRTVTLYVNPPAAPGIASSGVVLPVLGAEFNYPVVAYNAPDWYGASGLPPGLVIDPRSGVVSGVPTVFGDVEVSLVASNRFGVSTGSLTFRVSPVVGWSWTFQPIVPGGLSNVVAIAEERNYGLALTTEGTVLGLGTIDLWSRETNQPIVPGGLSNVVAIAAGGSHALALTADGGVMAWDMPWGSHSYAQTNVPSGLSNVVAIAAGSHSMALKADGRVVSWGEDPYGYGQTNVPSGLSNVVAIAAGAWHSLVLTCEGRIVAWGRNDFGESTVPSGLSNVVAIAAGGMHSLALTSDGLVVGWGNGTTVPSGLSNVVAIAAGGNSGSLAVTADGQIVAWQGVPYPIPNALTNVVAIATGDELSLALLWQPTVPTPWLELSRDASGLALQAHGASGISCQLLRASHLTGPWLPAQPVTFTNAVHRLRPPDTSESAQFYRLLRK